MTHFFGCVVLGTQVSGEMKLGVFPSPPGPLSRRERGCESLSQGAAYPPEDGIGVVKNFVIRKT